jgi:hypothetical protein
VSPVAAFHQGCVSAAGIHRSIAPRSLIGAQLRLRRCQLEK